MRASRVPAKCDGGDEAGFVLVIWGLGLISLIALTVIMAERARVPTTANLIDNAKAEALAEAGINLPRTELVSSLSSGSPGGLMPANSGPESPVRTVHFTVKPDARNRFFDQLRKFADENAFAIRIAPVRPDNQHFLMQLWSDDIKGIGTNPFDAEKFRISFYYNSEPVAAISSAINRLANNLISSLTAVDGVAATPEE